MSSLSLDLQFDEIPDIVAPPKRHSITIGDHLDWSRSRLSITQRELERPPSPPGLKDTDSSHDANMQIYMSYISKLLDEPPSPSAESLKPKKRYTLASMDQRELHALQREQLDQTFGTSFSSDQLSPKRKRDSFPSAVMTPIQTDIALDAAEVDPSLCEYRPEPADFTDVASSCDASDCHYEYRSPNDFMNGEYHGPT
jgi:hypothetical protein